jgi:hypothetical protein
LIVLSITLSLALLAMGASRLQAQVQMQAKTPFQTAPIVPGRYIVVYRNAAIPGDAETRVHAAGARILRRDERLGMASVQALVNPHPLHAEAGSQSPTDDGTMRLLAAQSPA